MERNKKIMVWRGLLQILIVLMAGGGLGVSSWGAAEDVALYPNDGWVWRFAPVIGPQSYEGSVRVEGERGAASASLDDIADRATFQMSLQVEGHGEQNGFLIDLSYLGLNADLVNENGAANLSASLLSVDTLGSYGLGPWAMGTTSTGFELLGGGRWNQLNAAPRFGPIAR